MKSQRWVVITWPYGSRSQVERIVGPFTEREQADAWIKQHRVVRATLHPITAPRNAAIKEQ